MSFGPLFTKIKRRHFNHIEADRSFTVLHAVTL
jgi:hypothetical protein